MKKFSLILPLLCASLAFWACGDDDSGFGTSVNGGASVEAAIVVATFDDLLNCADVRNGFVS